MTLAHLLSIGAVWYGRDHDAHARNFLPVNRGEVLTRVAAKEDRWLVQEGQTCIGPIDPIGVDLGSF